MSLSNNFPQIRPSLLLDFANTQVLDPRITFTRASTATYYDGVTVAKAEENLFLQSQTFDNASWFKLSMSSTANSTVAPDGTTTADTITTTAGAGTDYMGQNPTIVSGLPYIASIYAKYSNAQWIRFRVVSAVSGNPSAWFDVQNGVIGTVESGITASITSVGNGWYRCTIAFTSISSSSDYRFYPSSADGAASQSIGLSVILWGAQLEQRSSVTAYTATTDQPITNYIPVLLTAPVNTARFEHNPTTGESLGLEIEESRTNLVTYSDDFSNAAWTKNRSSITSNTIIAPDGTLTGDALIEDTTTSNTHNVVASTSFVSGTTYTFTVYAKKALANIVQLTTDRVASTSYANFNLDTGVVSAVGSTATASITSVGNGWYRLAVSVPAIGTGGGGAFISLTGNNATATKLPSYTGDGYANVYIWGAQLEVGSFSTSYIPTVASQVIRGADVAQITGSNFSSWYNNAQGTLYADWASFDTGAIGVIAFDQSSPADRRLNLYQNGSRIVTAQIGLAGGGNLVGISSGSAQAINSNIKATFGYASNDYAVTANGLSPTTSTSFATDWTRTFVYLGSFYGTTDFLNGSLKKIAYYPIRVTNAQLQGLTSN